MKKILIGSFLLLLSLLSYQKVYSQGIPEFAEENYWHYRYRLTQYFEVMGMGQGQSLPATVRNGSSDGYDEEDLFWEDGPVELGYYIGVLATEYKLLASNNQDVSQTVMELYYALHTVFRLDSIGNNLFGVYRTQWPGTGYMTRDDVPSNFIANNPSLNPVGTPTVTYSANSVTRGYLEQTGEPCYVNTIASDYGTGNPVDAGVDNFNSLLLGLDLVVRLVPAQAFSWTQTNPNTGTTYTFTIGSNGSYPNGETIHQMAVDLGKKTLNYIYTPTLEFMNACSCPWDLLLDYTELTFTGPLPYAPAEPNGVGIPGSGGGWPAPATLSSPLTAQAANIYGLSLGPDGFGMGSFCWDRYYPVCHVGYDLFGTQLVGYSGAYCDNDNNVLGIVSASTSNDSYTNEVSGATVSAWDMIESMGSDNACLSCACASCSTQSYFQRNVFYTGVLGMLYPGSNDGGTEPWDFCEAETMLFTAPYDGPFYHSPSDFGENNWYFPRRFIDGDFAGSTMPTTGYFPGNYNGLDYMLLYNLYCLMGQTYAQTVSVPFNAESLGTTSSPHQISVPFCDEEISVTRLDPYTSGGLVLDYGVNSLADLKPTSGTIDIPPGAYGDIVASSTCCGVYESYVQLYQDFQYPVAVKSNPPTDTLNTRPYAQNPPLYKKTEEFDTLNAHDGIVSYPNPFQSQTTVEFSLKNDSPVSIYITNVNGERIATLIDNDIYSKGGHVIQYNGSSLAAGTYYLVFETQIDRQACKMVKAK